MEIDLDKQLVPYIEGIITQTLDMIESLYGEENFNQEEIRKLMFELENEFGDYTILLSPKIHGRIMEINHYILNNNKVYETSNLSPNIQDIKK